jgi:hypothetical protein
MTDMNDQEAQWVWQRVQHYRDSSEGRTLDTAKVAQFERVVSHIREQGQCTAQNEDDLQTVMALCWFGPYEAGPPPASLRTEVLKIIQSEAPKDGAYAERSIEIIIAYGCGVWRKIPTGHGSWEHRWPRAMTWVTRYVLGWMKSAAAWLHFDVELRGYAYAAPFPSTLTAEALASMLWLGVCDCFRLRMPDAAEPLDYQARSCSSRGFSS